jgi:hypothetical protein
MRLESSGRGRQESRELVWQENSRHVRSEGSGRDQRESRELVQQENSGLVQPRKLGHAHRIWRAQI